MDWTIEDLPEAFREIARATSLATALRLVDLFGGRTVYVPLPPRAAASALGEQLGDAVLPLARQFGGGEIAIPLLTTLQRAARNREMREAYANGATAALLARQYEMSVRGVRKILGGCSR